MSTRVELYSGKCGFPRGGKTEGLRNWSEMVDTGPDSWRTDTKGLGGGRSAVLPSIFLGAVSLPNRDPDPSTILRVMVRYSNHELLDLSSEPKVGPKGAHAEALKTVTYFLRPEGFLPRG